MPSLSLSPAPNAATADYCRRARRLRARLATDPTRLHAALRDLAHTDARVPRTVPADVFFQPTTPGPARIFSSRVAAALSDGVLRYSARKDLLREAAQMGIARFEANLLIAAVQHGESRPVRTTTYTLAPNASPSALRIALTAIAVQALIVAAVWWVAHT